MSMLLRLLLIALPLNAAVAEESLFGNLDRDRDGQLSAREVATLSLNFSALDTDGNGYLSRSELARAQMTDDRPKMLAGSSKRDAETVTTLETYTCNNIC